GTVNLVSDGTLLTSQATGQQYRIIDNQTGGTQGTFFSVNGVPITSPQQTFTFGGVAGFRLNHFSGDGNDVQLTAPGAMVQDLAVTPEVINEGDTVTLSGVGVDDNPDNQFFLLVDWGDGSKVELYEPGHEPFTIPPTYANNPAGQPADGQYTVFVQWFNQFLAGNSKELFVTVNNVAPALGDLAVTSPIFVGETATLSGSITDPGLSDSHTLVVDWGDGNVETFAYDPGFVFFELPHPYEQEGTYVITLTVNDPDGGADVQSLEVVVQGGNAPSAGQNGPLALDLRPLPA